MNDDNLVIQIPVSPASPLSRLLGTLRLRLMGLGDRDLAPPMRAWAQAPPAIASRLTQIVQSFATGYNLGMSASAVPELLAGLQGHDAERRGFAYEGAGMALAIRAQIWPGNHILADFLAASDKHHYIIQVGAGWAMARVPLRHGAVRAQLDPVFHWLAMDGFGFHQTFFHTAATVDRQGGRPSGGYAGAAFDQGVGRALWFVRAADPAEVAATIARFPEARRADLWGGAGLAAGYAGGVDAATLESLTRRAGPFRAHMGVGTLLALRTRSRAGNLGPHTELAVRVLCGGEPESLLSQVEAEEAKIDHGDEGYPQLRERLRVRLAALH